MSTRTVRAACPHDCPDTCALLVTVENGRAIRVAGDPAHPATRGVLCTKVARYTERTYHPERLLYPLQRIGRKGEGRFRRISWDEALAIIGSRLKEIAGRDAQRILPYSYAGTMGYVQGESMAARFFHRLGASLLERTICAAAGTAGIKATYGGGLGFDVDFADEAKLILLWGCNPITSSLHYWTRVQEAKRRGARVIAIDPYRSLTAEKCHQHIALLPGSDSALALGMIHILIRERLLDHDYVAAHTLGFDALRARALEYPPERVAQLCGIDQQQVLELALTYGRMAVQDRVPVAIRIGYGVQRGHGGGQAVRALACLPSLVGAWRHRAGGALHSSSAFFPLNSAGLQRPDLIPGWPKMPRTVNMSGIGDALQPSGADPAIEALVVYNANPVAVAPDSARVAAGFAREDLFTVVLEHFQTDTADYADILLPATTQLEHFDIHKSYGHTYVLANNPAIAPLGEAKPNSEIFRLMARQLGFVEACFDDSDEMLAAQAFNFADERTRHMNWETLKQNGWAKLNLPEAPFARGGFTTPSGKCEFYSAQLAASGHDPLPGYVAPHESAQSPLARSFPLAMISPPARHFLNSSFVNVDSLRAIEGEPAVHLHPLDAAERGVADGQTVQVWNQRGSLNQKAHLTERARRGVVVIPSIWWKKLSADGKNANELTSQALTDLGNAPTFYDCLVQVRAADLKPQAGKNPERASADLSTKET